MSESMEDVVGYCPECGQEYDGTFNACPEDGSKLYHFRGTDADDDPMIGEVIEGRFRIEQVLGEGGMGKVYRAVQTSVGRPVAVKLLQRTLGDNKEFSKRFMREANVISGFNHPNIVRLIEFGQDLDRDIYYLVMEMIDGTDLSGLLERGRLTVDFALEVAAQVCAALSEPHSRGVIHRDLKPDNIMLVVTSDGSLQVKVLDFGIAQAAEGKTKLTKTGMVHGTPSYMAPEQAQGADMTETTDVYALGMILFEMLVGRAPFVGETAMQVILQQVQQPPPELGDYLGPDQAPDALVELVGEMIRKSADKRPKNMLAIRDQIEAIQMELGHKRVRLDTTKALAERYEPWLRAPVDGSAQTTQQGRQVGEPVDVPTGRAEAPTERDVGESVGPAAPADKARRWPWVMAIMLVIVLAAAGVGAWWWLPPMEYVGPGSASPDYVWAWSDDPDYAWPWEIDEQPPAAGGQPAPKLSNAPANKSGQQDR